MSNIILLISIYRETKLFVICDPVNVVLNKHLLQLFDDNDAVEVDNDDRAAGCAFRWNV